MCKPHNGRVNTHSDLHGVDAAIINMIIEEPWVLTIPVEELQPLRRQEPNDHHEYPTDEARNLWPAYSDRPDLFKPLEDVLIYEFSTLEATSASDQREDLLDEDVQCDALRHRIRMWSGDGSEEDIIKALRMV